MSTITRSRETNRDSGEPCSQKHGVTINLDRDAVLSVLQKRGWAQDTWEADDGKVCLHQAIKLCTPVPGDFHLVRMGQMNHRWATAG